VTDHLRPSRSPGELSKTIARLVVKGVRIIGVQGRYDSARRGDKLLPPSHLHTTIAGNSDE
jgi:hypothetical protein